MKKKMEKNILAWLLAISMIIPMVSSGIIAKAAETSNATQKEISRSESQLVVQYSEISEYKQAKDKPPVRPDWVFAGWYRDEACKTAIATDVTTGSYYAKFVPEAVLGVKTQVSADLMPPAEIGENTKGAIRFVTSVDSLAYQNAGFYIKIGSLDEQVYANDKVYDKLFYIENDGTGVSENPVKTATPQKLFCEASNYFKTQTFTGIPSNQFDESIQVTPFWETLDGTIVKGTSVTKTVNEGIKAGSYIVKSYEELQTVLQFVENNNLTNEVTIKVAESFEMPSKVTIGADRNITLKNQEEAGPITLYRGAGLTAAMFEVAKDGTLTLQGVGEKDSFVLDGRTGASDNVNGTESLLINKGNLTLDNLKAQYVIKTEKAGAVINNAKEAESLTINNSTFDSNKASASEGAVLYNAKKANITGSTFTNNKAATYGGAISNIVSEFSIKDCTFDTNKAIKDNGGAIYNTAAGVKIDACTFTGNEATTSGGAISNAGASLVIKDCTFDTNKDINDRGGAVYNTAAEVNIDACTFKNNTSGKNNGGAIFNSGAGVSIVACTFEGNKTVANGGAISNNNKEFSIDACMFTGNTAKMGGAVFSVGIGVVTDLTVKNSTFTGNTATDRGGAIRNDNSTTTVTDCQFDSNTAEATGGGAINSNASLTLQGTDVAKAFFKNNQAKTSGGAVYLSKGTLEGSGYLFEGNTPDDIVKATGVTNNYREYSAKNATELRGRVEDIANLETTNAVCIKITESFELANDISIPTGRNIVLLSEGEDPITICRKSSDENGVFNIPQGAALTIRGAGAQGSFVLDGRTQAEIGSDTPILIENTTGQTRSLITNKGSLTLDNVKVQYVKRTEKYGAVIANNAGAVLTIRDSEFAHNYAYNGGAVLYNAAAEVRIEGSTFTDNQAGNTSGGAIYSTGTQDGNTSLTVVKSIFVNNTAKKNGGAIYNEVTEFSIEGGTFTGNQAEIYGGAIHNKAAKFSITDSKFEKNKAITVAGAAGGAVYHEATNFEECTITNTTFTGNEAKDAGGALRNAGGTMIVTDCQFEGNTAAGTGGGAIYNNKDLTLQGTDVTKAFFKNNQATGTSGKGGAICNSGTLRGSGYLFEGNTPDGDTPNGVAMTGAGVSLYQ